MNWGGLMKFKFLAIALLLLTLGVLNPVECNSLFGESPGCEVFEPLRVKMFLLFPFGAMLSSRIVFFKHVSTC